VITHPSISAAKESKCFFLKKEAKTFYPFGFGASASAKPTNRNFLVLFFKKEPLAFPRLGTHQPTQPA
jgi:hypothetical protein